MTPELYRAVIKPLAAKVAVLFRVAGGILIVCGLAFIALSDTAEAIGSLVGGIMFGLLVQPYLVWISVRRAAPMFGPWNYEIDEYAITLTTPIVSSRWPWTSLSKVTEKRDFWMLSTPVRGQALPIIKSGFSDAGLWAIADLLRRRPSDAVAAPNPHP
jgi:hypothetical protein